MREANFLLLSSGLKNKKLPTIIKPKIIHDPPVHRRAMLDVKSYSKYTSVPKYAKKNFENNGTKIATGIAHAKLNINNFLRFLVKIPYSTKDKDKMKKVSKWVIAIMNKRRTNDRYLLFMNDFCSSRFGTNRSATMPSENAIRLL
jgi:hypothetical protein